MPKYIISACPLVKIYLKEWQERLTEDPEQIFNSEQKFDFSIATGTTAFRVTFNKPMLVQKPVIGSSYQAEDGRSDRIIQLPNASMTSEGKEIDTLYGWLVGEAGQSYHETDIFGCVPFEPGFNVLDRVDQMAAFEALLAGDSKEALKAKRELDKIQQDTALKIATARAKVIKDSEFRIKRAMKTVHNNLIRQWEINKESNLGKYPPSISEILGAHALDTELKAKAEKGKALYGKMSQLLSNVNT